jgi:cysteine synthase A
MPFQHRNYANLSTHYHGTGFEILRQLGDRRATHWIAGCGTGGTLVGVALALRTRFPDLVAIAVTPAEMPFGTDAELPSCLPIFSGGGGLGQGIRQPFVESFVPDVHHTTVSVPTRFRGCAAFSSSPGSASAAPWRPTGWRRGGWPRPSRRTRSS